jgi:hypothetical protein
MGIHLMTALEVVVHYGRKDSIQARFAGLVSAEGWQKLAGSAKVEHVVMNSVAKPS